jgi:hypothetical protein
VIVLIDSPEGLTTESWGDDIPIYEAVGMHEAAKRLALDTLFNDE